MKPVAYCSRTLTTAETRYAQIEKELLASVWVYDKFSRYLIGLESFLQTYHKPLISIINVQDLDKGPIRCQRLLMKLMRFKVKAKYVPGKQLTIADTLSRNPLPHDGTPNTQEEVQGYVDAKPASPQRLAQLPTATNEDEKLQMAMKCVRHGWPDYLKNVPPQIHDLFAVHDELSVAGDLLVRGQQIVIPEAMRVEIIGKLHEGHLGVIKCKAHAVTSVWSPEMYKDIEETVATCPHCLTQRPNQRKEPLMPTPLPDRPWQSVGADICALEGRHFLIVVDYYSRYIDIAHLSSMTSSQVIGKLKNIFARWGIPEEVVSDNGTQFSSDEYCVFATNYGFTHMSSRPHFTQSNGEPERAVQNAKRIMQQNQSIKLL